MPHHSDGSAVTRRHFVRRVSSAAICGLIAAARPAQGAEQPPPAAGQPSRDDQVSDLVAANRILARQGILDGFGHVSVRNARDPQRFFLSRSRAPDLVSAADIQELDLDSRTADARPGYQERFIHGEIYRARADVRAIVHGHSPSMIPFGVTDVPLRPVYHLAAFIGDGVPVFEIRQSSGTTDMLVSDAARGRALAASLGAHAAVLMRGHGVVVVGPSLPIVVGRAVYLETNATIQSRALALGRPITYLDPEEARQIMNAGENGGYARSWELWKQQVSGR